MKRGGFTLVELLVVLAVIMVLVTIIVPNLGGVRSHPRSTCGTNQNGLYKAMYTYSVMNNDSFPLAGVSDPQSKAIGFRAANLRGRESVASNDPDMVNNITASLWLLVSDGSVGTFSFVCPISGDEEGGNNDQNGIEVSTSRTWDFQSARNLSYSPLNMYHTATGDTWSSSIGSDFIFMGDKNNATGHTLRRGASREDVERQENSLNHEGDGQNVTFGDGHQEWSTNPFIGPDGDNIYAQVDNGRNAPPTLGNSDGDRATDEVFAKRDVVLIPLDGNGGVSLSGEPARPGRDSSRGTAWGDVAIGVIIIVVVVGVIVVAAVVMVRLMRGAGKRGEL